jgi:hypothetical protein
MHGIKRDIAKLPDHRDPGWCTAQVRLVEKYNERHPPARCFGDLQREQMTPVVAKDEMEFDRLPPKKLAREGDRRDRKRSKVLQREIDAVLDEKLPALAGQTVSTDELLTMMPRRLLLECGEPSLRVRTGLRLGARGHVRFTTESDCGKGRSKWRIVKERRRR